jgi:dTDP-4-dehydrorhamnose 3,5-epimerase
MSDGNVDLAGITWGRIARHADERGSFRELWRESLMPEGFVQANLSLSASGVLRGLHVHRRQLDHWIVATGRAFVALVDLRAALANGAAPPRPGDVGVATRTLEADETVTIPAGIAHGFLALEPLELIYLVTNEYDGSDELGFAWDDPLAGVPWPSLPATPDGRPILSDRDRANPSLAELLADLRRPVG